MRELIDKCIERGERITAITASGRGVYGLPLARDGDELRLRCGLGKSTHVAVLQLQHVECCEFGENTMRELLAEAVESSASTGKKPIEMTCEKCNSTDVHIETRVVWSSVRDRWEPVWQDDDTHYCRACDQKSTLVGRGQL